jgi:F0F1-type ATP synthase delta subunit
VRESTVARNYAQALFTAGEHASATAEYGVVLDALGGAIESDDRIRVTLESPRVPKSVKASVLRQALTGRAPEPFVRFIDAVARRGRQALLPAICWM